MLSSSAEDKKARNSIPNHFIEEKKTENFKILFRTIPQKIKMLGIPFGRREKYSEFRSEPWSERKNLWKLVSNHSRTKKNTWMTIKTFFSPNFTPFRSEPTHMRRNSAKVAHFSRNYENRSESIPRNFDGNPTAKSIHSRGDMHVKQMFISLLAILRDRVKNTIFLDLLCVWIFWTQNSNLLEKGPLHPLWADKF